MIRLEAGADPDVVEPPADGPGVGTDRLVEADRCETLLLGRPDDTWLEARLDSELRRRLLPQRGTRERRSEPGMRSEFIVSSSITESGSSASSSDSLPTGRESERREGE